jgi:hypothetical protein
LKARIEYPAPEYLTPNVEPIAIIHGDSEGYVRFARKLDDEWNNLPSLPVSKLRQMFPEFAHELMRDSYFGINTQWRAGSDRPTRLNACWVDIDLHQTGQMQTVGQVIGKAIDMVRRGELPKPSMYVYSGRGAWLLWLLIDEEGKRPKAFPEKIIAQESINRELALRLHQGLCEVEVDMGVADASRMIRVPGSTNSKADPGYETVQFLPVLDFKGRGVEYTLSNLTERLGLRRHKDQKKLVGWRALWNYRFLDFKLLGQLRGGFSEGCRNRAGYIYVQILTHLGLSDSEIEHSLAIFGQECRPPLSGADQRSILKHHRKYRDRWMSDEKIGRYLKVTAEEGKRLTRWNRFQVYKELDEMDLKLGGNARTEYRKQVIGEIIAERGVLPSRQIAELMKQSGIDISHVTVHRLIQKMELPRPPQLLICQNSGS